MNIRGRLSVKVSVKGNHNLFIFLPVSSLKIQNNLPLYKHHFKVYNYH